MITYYQRSNVNIGDTLPTPILKELFCLKDAKRVDTEHQGKLVTVGSVASNIRNRDVVWGTGCIRANQKVTFKSYEVLALRGPLTKQIMGVSKTIPFADPGCLLPLMYNPGTEPTKKVAQIPNIKEHSLMQEPFISPALPWKKFVDAILEHEHVVSSSLHGIIIAEAYGRTAEHVVRSNKLVGKGLFKFQDYLEGTGRKSLTEKFNVRQYQQDLMASLYEYLERYIG